MASLATCSGRTPVFCTTQCRIRAFRPLPTLRATRTGVIAPQRQRLGRRKAGVATAMLGANGDLVEGVEEGTKIKVTSDVVVYHAPKRPELNLKGMEGTVKSIVKLFKGKELSANLPYRVEFMLEQGGEGKPQKVIAHLDSSEFEAAS